MRSSKIAAISLGLMAVISCSSAGINNTNNNKNPQTTFFIILRFIYKYIKLILFCPYTFIN